MDDVRGRNGAFAQGGTAVAEGGVVLLDGPDGIAVAMTPEAAEQTGSSLIEAATAAREQRSLHDKPA
jgi:hypothetical protein